MDDDSHRGATATDWDASGAYHMLPPSPQHTATPLSPDSDFYVGARFDAVSLHAQSSNGSGSSSGRFARLAKFVLSPVMTLFGASSSDSSSRGTADHPSDELGAAPGRSNRRRRRDSDEYDDCRADEEDEVDGAGRGGMSEPGPLSQRAGRSDSTTEPLTLHNVLSSQEIEALDDDDEWSLEEEERCSLSAGALGGGGRSGVWNGCFTTAEILLMLRAVLCVVCLTLPPLPRLIFLRNLPPYEGGVRPIMLPPREPTCAKPTLVLDLDETLVHASITSVADASITFAIESQGERAQVQRGGGECMMCV